MDKLSIGIISLAVVVAVAMFNGIDGTLAMTGITAIGGLVGYKVKTVKDKTVPSKVQLPAPIIIDGQVLPSMRTVAVTTKVPMRKADPFIDFIELDRQIRAEMVADGMAFTWAAFYTYAERRAFVAPVNSVNDSLAWVRWLLNIAKLAFEDAFGVECPSTESEIDIVVAKWSEAKCQVLRGYRKRVVDWVEDHTRQLDALARLNKVGVSWGKINVQFRTALGIARLADNPIVHIGVTSEDVVG